MNDLKFVTQASTAGSLLGGPVADAFQGTAYTDIVNWENFAEVYFIAFWGVGATGTTTFTVQSCDDASASNSQAIPFQYKRLSSGETNTDWTVAASTGVLTTAGSNQAYIIKVSKNDAYLDYEFLRLKSVESVDSPILGGVLIMMAEPRFMPANEVTVTS